METSLGPLFAPLGGALAGAWGFLELGGGAIWALAALSVLTLAVILWKLWRLLLLGAFSRRRCRAALALWSTGDRRGALTRLGKARGLRARLARTAMEAEADPAFGTSAAREETERVARDLLSQARGGLRLLELIATIAPLLGLFGTVLGMIGAFQALQEAGAQADPATLAGGIWEALLTTAAGMAIAIPASMALSWFDSVVERLRHDMEDTATRVFLAPEPERGAVRLGEAAA